MSEEVGTGESLTELAERAMADKREESPSEGEARELYDVPSADPRALAEEQPETPHNGA